MGVCDPRDPSTMNWCGDYEGSTVFVATGRTSDDRAATGSAGQPSPVDIKHHVDHQGLESTQNLIQQQQQQQEHRPQQILVKEEPNNQHHNHHHHHHHQQQQQNLLDYQELKPAPLSNPKDWGSPPGGQGPEFVQIGLPPPGGNNNNNNGDVNTNSPSQDPNSVACAGCRGKILDRFFLQAVDLPWHVACLKCSQCGIHLEGALTCFARQGRIYCKDDYYRLFGILRQCGGCGAGIGANELVMRARDRVYHVNCFRCDQCGIPLSKGDHFGMRSQKIFCRTHFEALDALMGPDQGANNNNNNNGPPAGVEVEGLRDCNGPPLGRGDGGLTPPPPMPPTSMAPGFPPHHPHMDMGPHHPHPGMPQHPHMLGKHSNSPPPPPPGMMGPLPPPPPGMPPHPGMLPGGGHHLPPGHPAHHPHLHPFMPGAGGSPLGAMGPGPRFDIPGIPVDHQRLMGYPDDPTSGVGPRPVGLGMDPNGPNMAAKLFSGASNGNPGTPTRGRPRKKRKDAEANNMMTSINSMGEMITTADGYCVDGSGYVESQGGGAGQPRAKRVRTSFKHHQLRTMKSYFSVNHNPDAKDLKTLSQKTGLPKRVLQVWFQNARAKWRRTVQRQPGSAGAMPGTPGGGSVGGDCMGSDGSQDGMGPNSGGGKMSMGPGGDQVPGLTSVPGGMGPNGGGPEGSIGDSSMDMMDGMDAMDSMDMDAHVHQHHNHHGGSRSPSELYSELP